MAIFRVERTSDYTVMSNHHLRNKELSLKAKGLLSQMLSLPEDWDYTLSGLAKINRESVDAIRTAVQELEKAGYITRRQCRDDKGKLSGNEYTIYEYPHESPQEEDTSPEEGESQSYPLLDFPTTDNPSTENPLPDNPLPEKPLSENPTQLNKDILNTDISKKESKKKKGRTGKPKAPPMTDIELKEYMANWIQEVAPGWHREIKLSLLSHMMQFYLLEREDPRRNPTRSAAGLHGFCSCLLKYSGGDYESMIEHIDRALQVGARGLFPLDNRNGSRSGGAAQSYEEEGIIHL